LTLFKTRWLVDDVSITVSNLATGTIVVSNNINLAGFTITGAKSYTGKGALATFTNCPSGQYVINYYPVQFYQIPLSQTNYLDANQTIVFTGNYSFSDTNHNNISDEWEQFYFEGSVTNQFSDSDNDGMSDYAEFIAGTNPLDAKSLLELQSSRVSKGQVLLIIPTISGRGYKISETRDLFNWSTLYDWFRATNALTTITIPSVTNQMFYRIEVKP
jgi:hypothetical protein